jgi:DNA ligase 4
MQQATPVPTEDRSSPPPESTQTTAAAEDHPVEYPVPPQNIGSAPFYVLSALFDRLQTERKPDKRRRLLDTWFNVCSGCSLQFSRHSLFGIALARREGI